MMIIMNTKLNQQLGTIVLIGYSTFTLSLLPTCYNIVEGGEQYTEQTRIQRCAKKQFHVARNSLPKY